MRSRYDVVVVGGGHNGLVAAAFLARAARSVLVLERSERLGGATVSESPFEGIDVRLSRYAYLVSLLPRWIGAELGLRFETRRRRIASYTPVPGSDTGRRLRHLGALLRPHRARRPGRVPDDARAAPDPRRAARAHRRR